MENTDLLNERIAHAETRQQLYRVQGQLLSLLAQQGQAELAALQAQLPPVKPPQKQAASK